MARCAQDRAATCRQISDPMLPPAPVTSTLFPATRRRTRSRSSTTGGRDNSSLKSSSRNESAPRGASRSARRFIRSSRTPRFRKFRQQLGVKVRRRQRAIKEQHGSLPLAARELIEEPIRVLDAPQCAHTAHFMADVAGMGGDNADGLVFRRSFTIQLAQEEIGNCKVPISING